MNVQEFRDGADSKLLVWTKIKYTKCNEIQLITIIIFMSIDLICVELCHWLYNDVLLCPFVLFCAVLCPVLLCAYRQIYSASVSRTSPSVPSAASVIQARWRTHLSFSQCIAR